MIFEGTKNKFFFGLGLTRAGVTTPDITMLPVLAEYFQVSVDMLLGLVPLVGEMYDAQETDSEKFWNGKLHYLLQKQKMNWNEDYLEFLICQVWKIEKPVDVLDLGCGYGYMGILLLRYLPEGSTYTGVDFSHTLLQYGKKLFEREKRQATWVEQDILEFQGKKNYDVVLCQSVMRHLGNSAPVISKMKKCAKDNGWIVCMDTNRELELDGLYVEGIPYEELCHREGVRKHWLAEYENGDRDYAAAMHNAYEMYRQGIVDIQVRMNDKVEFAYPEREDYEESIDTMKEFYSSWYDNPDEGMQRLMNHGMTRKEAEKYVSKGQRICQHLEENSDVKYTWFRGKTITFGRKGME